MQKLWWGWAGWGWRQILPPHQHNAKLWGEEEKNHHRLIYFREVREREADREQTTNHKAAMICQTHCSQAKWNYVCETYGAITHSRESPWREFPGADLCCPPAGSRVQCTNNIPVTYVHLQTRLCRLMVHSLDSPCRKDSVGMKKAAVHIPSRVMNFKNQKLDDKKKLTETYMWQTDCVGDTCGHRLSDAVMKLLFRSCSSACSCAAVCLILW